MTLITVDVEVGTDEMANRIEELEAKLAKAEQLINELRYAWSVRDLTQADFDKARAELKGQDDE